MKYFIVSLCCMFLIACSGACGTGRVHNIRNSPNPQFSDIDSGDSAARREATRQLLKYIQDRTVKVERDCSPKEGVILVGVSDPKGAFDGGGSGAILKSHSDRSYIVTAAHVAVLDSEYKKGFDCKIYIQLNKDVGKSADKILAEVLAYNEARDLAVLKIAENLQLSSEVEELPFVGEKVWANDSYTKYTHSIHRVPYQHMFLCSLPPLAVLALNILPYHTKTNHR